MPPLRRFGDFALPCPRNSVAYLTSNYGEDWRETGRSQSYDHVLRESKASEKNLKLRLYVRTYYA